MCGIAGIVARDAGSVDPSALRRLSSALAHRGPDGDGTWTSPSGRVAFAHRRLAILDLSERGAQPMFSADGRLALSFNGEIYNYVELRRELEARGERFASDSDTEVLLRWWQIEGHDCLRRLDGMFAFAIHDGATQTVSLVRDAMGEKPLYVARSPGRLAFASEVRALVAAGFAAGRPDRTGFAYLLRQGSIPPPHTHVEGVEFLSPGGVLEIDATSLDERRRRYWTLPFVAETEALADPEAALRQVEAALTVSVARRLRADVPVGAFLSGGVDSALVCALAQRERAGKLATFTVTLPGQKLDEAEFARAVARRLGTEHTEIPLELEKDGSWLEQALQAMDVPSNDGPNTWLVSRAVRQAGFKVALSGLGGDELFFGYPSFRSIPRIAPWARLLRPLAVLGAAGRALARSIPAPPRWGRVVDAAFCGAPLAALWLAQRGLFSAHEAAEFLADATQVDFDPVRRLDALAATSQLAPARRVSALELSAYMHDQLLRDSDAMSMAHALELRVPLIGLPVVEAAGRLGAAVLSGRRPKDLPKRILERELPGLDFDRPKQGFVLNWDRLLANFPLERELSASTLFAVAALGREVARYRAGRTKFARVFTLVAAQRAVNRLAMEKPASAESRRPLGA